MTDTTTRVPRCRDFFAKSPHGEVLIASMTAEYLQRYYTLVIEEMVCYPADFEFKNFLSEKSLLDPDDVMRYPVRHLEESFP